MYACTVYIYIYTYIICMHIIYVVYILYCISISKVYPFRTCANIAVMTAFIRTVKSKKM